MEFFNIPANFLDSIAIDQDCIRIKSSQSLISLVPQTSVATTTHPAINASTTVVGSHS